MSIGREGYPLSVNSTDARCHILYHYLVPLWRTAHFEQLVLSLLNTMKIEQGMIGGRPDQNATAVQVLEMRAIVIEGEQAIVQLKGITLGFTVNQQKVRYAGGESQATYRHRRYLLRYACVQVDTI